MSQLFHTDFCLSGQCIRHQIADLDRVIECLSDSKNAVKERKERDRLVREYQRLCEDDGLVFSSNPCGGL